MDEDYFRDQSSHWVVNVFHSCVHFNFVLFQVLGLVSIKFSFLDGNDLSFQNL